MSFGKIIYQLPIHDIYDPELFSDNIYKLIRPTVREDNVFDSV